MNARTAVARTTDSRAAVFGALLSVLLAAHNVGDHLVQSDVAARRKIQDDHWQGGMAAHVGSYTLAQLAAIVALRGLGVRPSWPRVLAGVAFSAVTHAFIDRRWPIVALLEKTGSHGFAKPPTVKVWFDVDGWGRVVTDSTGVPTTVELEGALPLHGRYLADQAAHHACLAISAAIMAGGR